MKLFSVIVMSLVCAATTAPLDSDTNHRAASTTAATAAAEVKIPPYMKKIYKMMSQAMDQDDLHISLKYLRTVQTVHWLEPLTHNTIAAVSTGVYRHQYTVSFNVSGLLQNEVHPGYIELFLHVQTRDTPAQIMITSEHTGEPVVWSQPSQATGMDDHKKDEVQLVRIGLTSPMNSSLWQNDSIVTLTLASTNILRMPSKNHHQNALGLVLYIGGAPEAIEELLTTPIKTRSHTTYSIGATAKRSTGSTPCQLQTGFRVKFSDVRGGYERIVQPEVVDIGRCVGECPHFLHHLHNPSRHAEVRNLLAFREGSAGADITTASCVPASFKPLPVMLYNEAERNFSFKTYNNMVATSCGCR